MALFTPAGANYIAVVDTQAAAAWYIGKLGLRKVKVEMDDGVALGFIKDEYAFCLVLSDSLPANRHRMLNSSNQRKAGEFLITESVNLGDILQDRQGTHYFEMRNMVGNAVEITEER